jgi:chromosome partitioning protein
MPPMRVAVVNLKGGVGKTTTAVNLAVGLNARGPTLLIDTDPQRSALSWSEAAGDAFPPVVVSLPVRDLHRRMGQLTNGYAHVVIDCPPGEGDRPITQSALMAADVAVVPLSPSPLDVDRIGDTIALIASVEQSTGLTWRLLLVKVRQGTRSSKAVRDVLAVDLGMPIFAAEVPLREGYANAFGAVPEPTADYYAAVVEELVAQVPQEATV